MMFKKIIIKVVKLLRFNGKYDSQKIKDNHSSVAKIRIGRTSSPRIGRRGAIIINGQKYEYGNFENVIMRDYLPDKVDELAAKLDEIYKKDKVIKLVFSPASVPTQKIYVQLAKNALEKMKNHLRLSDLQDISQIDGMLMVDDGPFTYSAEASRKAILGD